MQHLEGTAFVTAVVCGQARWRQPQETGALISAGTGQSWVSKSGRSGMRPGVKTLLLVLMFCAAASPAHAQSLRVTGEAGYLSEWEVSGNVAESISGRVREFSGSLTMKHVGLCSQAGPEEKVAEIKLQIAKSGLWPHFHAAMTMDGSKCTFSGKFSDAYSGLMDCADAKGVPITLWIK
jgi:hypothetical protein